MSFKYISPKEIKILKKERIRLMREAEEALRNELYTKVAEKFREIIKISDQMGDNAIKSEFLEKLEILTSKIPQTSTESPVIIDANTIARFIEDLRAAPSYIIREVTEPIAVFGKTAAAIPVAAMVTEVVGPSAPIDMSVSVPQISGAPIQADSGTPPTKAPPAIAVKPKIGPPLTAKPKPPIVGPPRSVPQAAKPSIVNPPESITKPISKPIVSTITKPVVGPPKTIPTVPAKPATPVGPPTASSKPPSPIGPRPIAPNTLKPVATQAGQTLYNPEFADIEEEIKKMGSVEDQLKELKDIINKEQKKKLQT